jgi:hypothetical protein
VGTGGAEGLKRKAIEGGKNKSSNRRLYLC